MASMGFALDDCRAAVEAGKLTIEDAVEWFVYIYGFTGFYLKYLYWSLTDPDVE